MGSSNLSKKPLHGERERKEKISHTSWEEFLRIILTTFTEASYETAIKYGFRGSYFDFLSDFQESVQNIFHRSGFENLENLFSPLKKNRKEKQDHKALH